jgi:DNA-binding response OmpR family regulator
VLRVQSVLRRNAAPLAPTTPEVLVDGELRVDVAAHEVLLRGAPLALTVREYDLLVHFLRHPRQAFGREQLLKEVWGWEYADQSTVTVHVRRLREKVEDDPQAPRRIVTVFGVGYRYEDEGGS